MTHHIDRLMVNLGFSQSEVRRVRYRRTLYLGIFVMTMMAVGSIVLNIGHYAG